MKISLDEYLVWTNGTIVINQTLVYSWIVMAILIVSAIVFRIRLKRGKSFGKLQNFFEVVITILEDQIKKIGECDIKNLFPYVATLFIYIFLSNMISLIPGFKSPTASLSTTVALTIIVIFIGFINGFVTKGFLGCLSKYVKPVPFLLPLNIISDITSNFSLAIRLYGNVMAGSIISIILLQISFLSVGFPVLMSLLSVISGAIQAYIFTILAMINISATSK